MNINNLEINMLRKIVSDIQNECIDRVVDIILFGSYAKGTATSKSDVDILVVLKGTLENVEDFVNIPKTDYETMRKRHNCLIHICLSGEKDYIERKNKILKDVPDYGISILNI